MKKTTYQLTTEQRDDIIKAMLTSIKFHSFFSVLFAIIYFVRYESIWAWTAGLFVAYMVYTFLSALYLYMLDEYTNFVVILAITSYIPNSFLCWLMYAVIAGLIKLLQWPFKGGGIND